MITKASRLAPRVSSIHQTKLELSRGPAACSTTGLSTAPGRPSSFLSTASEHGHPPSLLSTAPPPSHDLLQRVRFCWCWCCCCRRARPHRLVGPLPPARVGMVVPVRRCSPPALTPPTAGIDRPRPPPCCRCMFQVFQMFHRYVASVSYGCCKSRSGCCIYCNGCTRMLQAPILNVSSIFFDVCCKCVYLDVAYVFTYMMQVFYLNIAYVTMVLNIFSDVFASVLNTCFKCFICF
jgi:hypothetical protein